MLWGQEPQGKDIDFFFPKSLGGERLPPGPGGEGSDQYLSKWVEPASGGKQLRGERGQNHRPSISEVASGHCS